MQNQIRMLIVDDDPIAAAVIRKQLEIGFPGTLVELQHEPIIFPGYNIYLLDNDFRGEHMAGTLVREARSLEPSSLIVALSTTLTLEQLNQMVNDGCNAVFDKRNPQESYQAKQVITNYISILEDAMIQQNRGSILSVFTSIERLLRQWNQRLANTRS